MLVRIGEEKTLCLSSAFSSFSLEKGGTQLETWLDTQWPFGQVVPT